MNGSRRDTDLSPYNIFPFAHAEQAEHHNFPTDSCVVFDSWWWQCQVVTATEINYTAVYCANVAPQAEGNQGVENPESQHENNDEKRDLDSEMEAPKDIFCHNYNTRENPYQSNLRPQLVGRYHSSSG